MLPKILGMSLTDVHTFVTPKISISVLFKQIQLKFTFLDQHTVPVLPKY